MVKFENRDSTERYFRSLAQDLKSYFLGSSSEEGASQGSVVSKSLHKLFDSPASSPTVPERRLPKSGSCGEDSSLSVTASMNERRTWNVSCSDTQDMDKRSSLFDLQS